MAHISEFSDGGIYALPWSLIAKAASSFGFCLDRAQLLNLVKGMGKAQGTGQIVKNSIPELQHFALACFLRGQGFSWPAASPSGQPLPVRLFVVLWGCVLRMPISHPPLGAPGQSSAPCFPSSAPCFPRRGLGAQAPATYLICASRAQPAQLCVSGSVNTLNVFL